MCDKQFVTYQRLKVYHEWLFHRLSFITHYVGFGKYLSDYTLLQYISNILGYLYLSAIEIEYLHSISFLKRKTHLTPHIFI